jgi:perosamine synthetase
MTRIRIPLSAPDIAEADIEAVVGVLRTSQLSLGPQLKLFEQEFASYVGSAYAIAVNSGTSGLHLCMRAFDIQAGDQVIVPSFTFIAAANAIRMVGARPVFVDIDPVTLNLDPESVAAAITPQTRAILVVHTFGRPAAMARILELAKQHRLILIEAIGAEYRSRKVGTLGDVGVFGFYPNKQITTGEGGMIVTNRLPVAQSARSLRNQGRVDSGDWFDHAELGYNYRLSEIHCALGRGQLHRLENILERRAQVAAWYHSCLEGNPDLILPALDVPDGRISWFVYAVRLSARFRQADRDAIIQALKEQGIGCGRYFAPIHMQPACRDLPPPKNPLWVTEQAGQRSIALPFFNAISFSAVQEVCRSLKQAMASLSR